MNLSQYASNITSQFGEDGILAEIVRILGADLPTYCVEFGAWDGKHLSNTWSLVSRHGWSVCYVEADRDRYLSLKRSHEDNPRVTAINAFVTDRSVRETSLQVPLLEGANAPRRIGILSIDIDGNDYNVWRDFDGFETDVVVIEYNYTIPPDVEYIDDGGKAFMGSSALALDRLARSKGYSLVACTIANCIFVRDVLFPRFDIQDNSVAALMPRDGLTFLARNFAGEVVFSSRTVVEPMIGAIGYRKWRKWLKLLLKRKSSFRYLGEDY
jgi:hypothetical protein